MSREDKPQVNDDDVAKVVSLAFKVQATMTTMAPMLTKQILCRSMQTVLRSISRLWTAPVVFGHHYS